MRMKEIDEKITGTFESDGEKKLHAAWFSVYVNIFLILMKTAVAVLTGSLAILAELAHSFFDFAASVLAYVGIRKAHEPPDKDHLYGHERYENLSALAQTLLIVITSLLIFHEAAKRISHPRKLEATEIGLVAMVVTIGVDYFLSRYLHRSSRRYRSSALEADAYHFTTDLWGALAVIVGLIFVIIGFPVFDAIAAIAVAGLMLWVSFKLAKKSVNALMDTSPPPEIMNHIDGIISASPGIVRYHKLRARHAGNRFLVEFHVHVSPEMSVENAHAITHDIKSQIMEQIRYVKDVTIHIEPAPPE
ncbi:MAG: cation diffusion facilitator family transporter [Candidatus Eisenbacteria bacterium]|nr:cation diffusion facilitator family transporter [Candidatus Eisenbacteria bacterium]